MYSYKAYWKLVFSFLLLPGYVGFQTASAATLKSEVGNTNAYQSSEATKLVAQKENLDKEEESEDTAKLKCKHRAVARCYKPCGRYHEAHYEDDEHEEHHPDYVHHEEHGRGRGHDDEEEHEEQEHRGHHDYEHEHIHFGRHYHRHGRRHCI